VYQAAFVVFSAMTGYFGTRTERAPPPAAGRLVLPDNQPQSSFEDHPSVAGASDISLPAWSSPASATNAI
jgi:hypothetical protein